MNKNDFLFFISSILIGRDGVCMMFHPDMLTWFQSHDLAGLVRTRKFNK